MSWRIRALAVEVMWSFRRMVSDFIFHLITELSLTFWWESLVERTNYAELNYGNAPNTLCFVLLSTSAFLYPPKLLAVFLQASNLNKYSSSLKYLLKEFHFFVCCHSRNYFDDFVAVIIVISLQLCAFILAFLILNKRERLWCWKCGTYCEKLLISWRGGQRGRERLNKYQRGWKINWILFISTYISFWHISSHITSSFTFIKIVEIKFDANFSANYRKRVEKFSQSGKLLILVVIRRKFSTFLSIFCYVRSWDK